MNENKIKISKSDIFMNAIIEIDRDEIELKEIFEYQKLFLSKIDKSKYDIEELKYNYNDKTKFKYDDIFSLCRGYSAYVNISDKSDDEKIIINVIDRERHKPTIIKYFRDKYPKELADKFIGKYKFSLPIISNNKIIEYNFNVISQDFIKDIRDSLIMYKNKIIIDLKTIKELLDNEQLNKFFNILYNSNSWKDTIDYNDYLNLINAFDTLLKPESNKIFASCLKFEGEIINIEALTKAKKYLDITNENTKMLNEEEYMRKIII